MDLARLAVGFMFALAVLPAAAGMYKIVGADGKVSYADTPPAADAKAARVSEFKVKSYTGPAVAGVLKSQPDWAAILRRPVDVQAAPAGVVMFSAEWCGHCQRAKQYMNAKGIAYSEIDIDKDARGKEEYQRLGARGVPYFVVGSKTLAGFSEAALEKLLQR